MAFNDITITISLIVSLSLITSLFLIFSSINPNIRLSIRNNADNVGVSVKTSFYMRHNVLDCIIALWKLVM
ncbi:hypothetical protein UT300008_12370 [Clostridium perfringens]